MRLRSGVFARAPPVPKMPAGLVQLMEGLTRDVLRHNPPDVLEFCASHVEQLILIRDGRAPPKHRLTLEQKIKKAQDKVRERAEQRRIKYDEEMTKVNQKLVKTDASASEEETPDILSSQQEDKPIIKDVENSAQPVMESKLKAPVHHEQDLEEALEVEIFHKPVEEICGIVTAESKDTNEVLQRESFEQHENLNEEIKNTITAEDKSDSRSEKETMSLANNNLNSLLEHEIINENNAQDSYNHVRTRRSLSPKKNDEEEENAIEHIRLLEEQKKINENAEESKSEIQDSNQMEEVSSNLIEENSSNVVEEVNDHTGEKDDADEKLKDMITNTTLEFDNATVFANEVPHTETLCESNNTNFDEVCNVKNSSDVPKNDDKTDPSINLPEQISVKEITRTENIILDEGIVEKVEIDEKVKKIDSSKATTEVETKEDSENKDELTNNIPTVAVANDDASDQGKNYIIIQNKKREEIINTTTPSKIDSVTEKHECSSDIKDSIDDSETDAIVKKLENVIVQNQLQRDSEINGKTNVEQQKALTDDVEEKIINVINGLEVCCEPIEVCPDNKDDGSKEKEKNKSEDNCNIIEELPAEVPVDKEELVIEKELVIEDNSDGAITSINKILVEEPGGGVTDDNDSVPNQQIFENTSNKNISLHINGTHELSNSERIIENGNESPSPEIIPSQDVAKEVEVISEIQDDVTNTSEPLKTDIETSSMGKSSSMDGSFIDEGVDTITEVDEMKNSPESTQNKANQGSMDLETAAITIQKVFRTFLFKSRESTFDDTGMGSNSIDGDSEKTEVEFPVTTAPPIKERRTLGISRMDTVLQTVNEEKSLSLSDDSSLSSAATIIQAHVRGFLTRNRLNSNKTNSSSLVNSDGPSSTSFDNDLDQKANKTVLNIHIVPEGEHFLSRDESLLTSIELSLDGSPPTSTNLHPLGYDKSEPRKQLKREDAIQSISPPSNNSGKLSEDIDSVKDVFIIDSDQQKSTESSKDTTHLDADMDRDDTPTKSTTIETVIETHKPDKEASSTPEPKQEEVETATRRKRSLIKVNSDESDVVTPFEDKSSSDSDATSRLLHSGEFHDVVLPTKVSRGDTSVVRGE